MVSFDMVKYSYDCNTLDDLSSMIFDLSKRISVPKLSKRCKRKSIEYDNQNKQIEIIRKIFFMWLDM